GLLEGGVGVGVAEVGQVGPHPVQLLAELLAGELLAVADVLQPTELLLQLGAARADDAQPPLLLGAGLLQPVPLRGGGGAGGLGAGVGGGRQPLELVAPLDGGQAGLAAALQVGELPGDPVGLGVQRGDPPVELGAPLLGGGDGEAGLDLLLAGDRDGVLEPFGLDVAARLLLVLVVGGVRRPAGPVGTGALELGGAGAPVLGGAGQVGVLATEVVLLGAAAGELLLEPAEPLGGGGDQPVGL